jgi:hypothetical protein
VTERKEVQLQEKRRAEERFFLYIDILGFSNLIRQKGKVEELYGIIDTLNVHRHHAFNTIIFSDTILVYNKVNPRNLEDIRYLVMFLCEFAKDLFYRLIGRDIYFRAYLTCGEFAHYPMENIKEVFYGDALVEAYNAEKKIQATGLFMSNRVAPYSDIFRTARFNQSCRFVYIMQVLQRHSVRKQDYPLDPADIVETDAIHFLAYDIRFLENIHKHKSNATLSPRVRQKYERTWRLLMKQHGGFMSTLVEHRFDPRSISRCDWSEVFRRIGTEEGSFG